MTLQDAREHIGEPVIDEPCTCAAARQSGVISSVNDCFAFVVFVPGTTPQACHPADLRLAEPGREAGS